VVLTISPGETVIHNRVGYKGKVCAYLIGKWKEDFSEPLWVMTNLLAEESLRIYRAWMKIEDEPIPEKDRIPGSPFLKKGKKWKRYSGLFILLK
jgi:hypothetical protein